MDEKNKFSINAIGILVLIVIIFLTIGYSSFSNNSTITNAVAVVKPDPKIRITSGITTSNGATVTTSDYSSDSVSSNVSMPNNSTVSYTVEITNYGNVPFAIYSISETYVPNDLKILSINGYNIGDKLCANNDNTNCTLNSVTTFTITVGYDNYTGNAVHQINLEFEFVRIYDVTYDHMTNNGYPQYAYDGKPFQVTFTGDVPADVVLNPNYTHTYVPNHNAPNQNNTLSVANITSDITIDRYYWIDYDTRGGTNPQNQVDRYLAGTSVNILSPTKTNDTFVDWYTEQYFVTNPISNTSNSSGNLMLYAMWHTDELFYVGDLVPINLTSKSTSSSWMDSNNGYDSSTGQYKIANTTYSSVASGTWTKENLDWYVWEFEEGSKLVLIGNPTSTNLTLNYALSYNNGIFFMNDIASQLYGCNIDGVSARSITMVDIWKKIFEYKQSVTYSGTTVNLVDNDGKAITSIITTNTTDMQNVIRGLFNTSYGNTMSKSPSKYFPTTLYNYLGLSGTPTINMPNYPALRDFEAATISSPVNTTTKGTGNITGVNWTYSITSFSNIIDSTSLTMLQSNTPYWIASRDYTYESDKNKAPYYFNFKRWNNNQITPATIYKSNTTSGQTATSGAIRPMIELDLTKVKLRRDGSIASLS